MHVLATNLILWIRTLMKESLDEIIEIGERHLQHMKAVVWPTPSSFSLLPDTHVDAKD
jgi:hypothetical protein